ncbi:MAG: hypothetical protein IPM64_12975 [Phycisphaerales bacterium]|nr:hypothetical protein [Phycisphaerales bacterium]
MTLAFRAFATMLAAAATMPLGAQTITNLGTLGGFGSFAADVNADGTVVVGHSYLSGGNSANFRRAFRWTPSGGMVNLGLAGSSTDSFAIAVSADGTVVAGNASDNGDAAWRWTQSGGFQAISVSGFADCVAGGMTPDGALVAGTRTNYFSLAEGVWWWTTSSAAFVASPYIGTRVDGVSNDGSTIAISLAGALLAPDLATYWRQSTGVVALPTPAPYSDAGLVDVNYNGTIFAGWVSGIGQLRAARWTDSGPQVFDPLTGFVSGRALDMHEYGDVIVGESNAGFNTDSGWIWIETFGLMRLSTYLANEGVDLTGWTLDYPTAISSDGTAIVGYGLYNGQQRAFAVRNLRPVCGPYIAEPPSSIEGCVGEYATLIITAYGPTFHSPVFVWYKWAGFAGWQPVYDGPTGSGMVISGATSAFLGFNNAQTDADGFYVCQVIAGCSTLTTSPVEVRIVEGSAVFADDAIPPIACSHGTVTMNAYPGPVQYGPFAVKWQRETAPASNVWVDLANGSTTGWDGNTAGIGGIVSGATTTSLTITADTANGRQLSTAHQRGYRCVATNACGSASYAKYLNVILVGDANCDDSINSFDIDLFVEWVFNSNFIIAPASYVSLGGTQDCWDQRGCWADLNHDSVANNFDIDGFVACIVSTPPAGRPCP